LISQSISSWHLLLIFNFENLPASTFAPSKKNLKCIFLHNKVFNLSQISELRTNYPMILISKQDKNYQWSFLTRCIYSFTWYVFVWEFNVDDVVSGLCRFVL
jgi:hypothetical protein